MIAGALENKGKVRVNVIFQHQNAHEEDHPSDFVNPQNTAIPLAKRIDYRNPLQKINLDKEGITVITGTELLNLPLLFEEECMTIPFAIVLMVTREQSYDILSYWSPRSFIYSAFAFISSPLAAIKAFAQVNLSTFPVSISVSA